MEIGERIKKRREELRMSQDELAKKVGYTSRSSVAKVETNANGMVQSKVVAFAKALQTTPAYLMGWVDDEETEKKNDAIAHIILRLRSDDNFREVVEDLNGPSASNSLLLIKKYNILNEIGKNKIDAYIDGLLENPSYCKGSVKMVAETPVSVPPKVIKKKRHT